MSSRLNMVANEKERISREIENNSSTKKYNDTKLNIAKDVLKNLERFKRDKQALLEELIGIRQGPNPNEKYQGERFRLAQDYNAWTELFEGNCKRPSENESEAKFIKDLIELEQRR